MKEDSAIFTLGYFTIRTAEARCARCPGSCRSGIDLFENPEEQKVSKQMRGWKVRGQVAEGFGGYEKGALIPCIRSEGASSCTEHKVRLVHLAIRYLRHRQPASGSHQAPRVPKILLCGVLLPSQWLTSR